MLLTRQMVGHNIVNVHIQWKLNNELMAIGILLSAKFYDAKFGLW